LRIDIFAMVFPPPEATGSPACCRIFEVVPRAIANLRWAAPRRYWQIDATPVLRFPATKPPLGGS
jgi:hypothetical protein